MKKLPLVAAMIILAAALTVGVMVRRKWSAAEPVETAKPAAGPAFAPAAVSRPKPDSIGVPSGGFDSRQVEVTQVSQLSMPMELSTSGRLVYNAELTKLVLTRVADRLDHILQFEGAPVREGQSIAELYAPNFISTQKEYLLTLNIARQLRGSNMKDLLEDVDVTVQSAAGRLYVLGVSDTDVAQIAKRGASAEHLTLRVPISGTIVKCNMDPGVFLSIGDSFTNIVDTRVLWLIDNVYENDTASVCIGQSVSLRTATYSNRELMGHVSFIIPNIGSATHTLTACCGVPNTDGLLRLEMHATVCIQTGNGQTTVVPKTALVKDHGGYYVIVQSNAAHLERTEAHGRDTGTDGNFAVTAGLDTSSRVMVCGVALLNEVIVKTGA